MYQTQLNKNNVVSSLQVPNRLPLLKELVENDITRAKELPKSNIDITGLEQETIALSLRISLAYQLTKITSESEQRESKLNAYKEHSATQE